MLEIRLKKGLVGKPANQRKIVAALGLHKFGSSVKHKSSPTITGMVKKIGHLLDVRECKEGSTQSKADPKTQVKTKKKAEDN